jgi:hypothetical protein
MIVPFAISCALSLPFLETSDEGRVGPPEKDHEADVEAVAVEVRRHRNIRC